MTLDRDLNDLRSLLRELCKLSQETEWVEFKHNNSNPVMIGEYISALANSAALLGKPSAYLVWGVKDGSGEVLGTKFQPAKARHKGQELESWLLQKTEPKINFRFQEFPDAEGRPMVILEIQAARHTPVRFDGTEYIRVGSYKKKLREFPEKERELWRVFDQTPFEHQCAVQGISAEKALCLLDYSAYFDLTKQPLPEGHQATLQALEADRLVQKNDSGLWDVTNLGAILFAKNLQDFDTMARKVVRIVRYKGNGKRQPMQELTETKGYAIGIDRVVDKLKALLPAKEEIVNVFRDETSQYPESALRELVANALIHQDFNITGTGPMIELFDTRLEITNPGVPLVDVQRFINDPPRSRNEWLASFMRRIGVCEERGVGIDEVIAQVEAHRLPPPEFEKTEIHTRVVLFAYKAFGEMSMAERTRACYQHCCLCYADREPMNNASVRKRFNFDECNSAMASRVIRQTVDADLIRLYDPEANRKAYRYVPFWA